MHHSSLTTDVSFHWLHNWSQYRLTVYTMLPRKRYPPTIPFGKAVSEIVKHCNNLTNIQHHNSTELGLCVDLLLTCQQPTNSQKVNPRHAAFYKNKYWFS